MSDSVNDQALAAKNDEALREDLIRQYEQQILQTASRASYRYISRSDDEWSVALCAFSDAVDRYEREKGEFLPFAKLLIRRALIDYHRSMASHLTEISVSPFVLDGTEDAEETTEEEKSVYLTVLEQSKTDVNRDLQDEIAAVNETLGNYGIRFFDLVSCSPQQEKTKQECAAAVRCVLGDVRLLEETKRSGKLPIRAIVSACGVSRKLLDRYRKYLIMAIVVLSGDYPQLSVYLKYMREEGKK